MQCLMCEIETNDYIYVPSDDKYPIDEINQGYYLCKSCNLEMQATVLLTLDYVKTKIAEEKAKYASKKLHEQG